MNNPEIPDAMQIASRLGAALQVQTISFDKDSPRQPFLEMHRLLEAQYPLVHRHLKREIINELSLLYTWQGTQADLAPVAFLAHMDVVPADASDWTHPPFSGEVADGFLYGRGVIDMKSQLVTLLEAVEALLEAGFTPRRTIHLAFGHDEEIGGINGARAIAETLQGRGTRLEALLDEGGGVAGGVALGIQGLIAIIACAEKSFANVRLEAAARAGHASMPGKTSAIGILSRAITRLERNPMPASLEFVRPTIRALAPRLPLPMRLLFSNLWLSGGLVKMALGGNAITNAMLRNTIAPTILQGGYKSNVLPEKASAVLNCRLLPEVEVEALLAHIRRVIQDERITVTCTDTSAPSRRPVSIDTPYYHDLEAVIADLFENIPASPMLLVGATDARHYQGLCARTYRFQPVLFKTAVEDRTHGVDERLEVEQLPRMVGFNAAMMQSWGSRGQEG